MAEPLRKPTIEPGQTRRRSEADFSYLNENAVNDPNASIDERFAQTAYQDNVLKPVGLGGREAANAKSYSRESESESTPTPQRSQASQARQNMLKKYLERKAIGGLADLSMRARASTVNAEAFSWQVPLWLFVQVPFAVLGIITLAAVGTVDSAKNASDGGVVAWVASKALEAAGTLAKFVGLDFMAIAMNLYLLSTVMILGIGIFSILLIWLQYTICFLKPLSGKAAGLKMGLLLLTIIGYSLPIANLFPFIFLWMAAVWFFPR